MRKRKTKNEVQMRFWKLGKNEKRKAKFKSVFQCHAKAKNEKWKWNWNGIWIPFSHAIEKRLALRYTHSNRRDNKAAKNCKRKERRKIKDKKRFFDAIESRKQYIKNLSNEQLTDKQITLLSRGLTFIPTPVTKENLIRRQLLADFNQWMIFQ